jgi:hypothetical protein
MTLFTAVEWWLVINELALMWVLWRSALWNQRRERWHRSLPAIADITHEIADQIHLRLVTLARVGGDLTQDITGKRQKTYVDDQQRDR